MKRKNEADREEKRRQHILAKRREKQREATEKFQRGHLGSRPPSSSSGKYRREEMSTHPGQEIGKTEAGYREIVT